MSKKVHYLHLDIFRGTAALLVFIDHSRSFFFQDYCSLGPTSVLVKLYYLITTFGHSAVIVFFVLSGCVISSSIESARLQGRWSWGDYLINRFCRLWMVLIPALILGGLLDYIGVTWFNSSGIYQGAYLDIIKLPVINRLGPVDFLGNVSFLQTIMVPPFGSNGPLWSIANEFWYYIIFPLLLFAFLDYYSKTVRIFFLLAAGALFIFVGKFISLYFIIWLLGAGSFYLFNRLKCSRPLLIRLMFGLGLFLCLAFLVANRIIYGDRTSSIFSDIILGILFSFVIYWALHLGDTREKSTYRLIAETLSKPSYSIYALHYPMIVFVTGIVIGSRETRWNPSPINFFYYLMILVGFLFYAYLTYRCTEAKTAAVRHWLKSRLLPAPNFSLKAAWSSGKSEKKSPSLEGDRY